MPEHSSSSESDDEPIEHHHFKVVLLGGEAVGKTAILRRLLHNSFEPGYTATIGADLCKAEVQITTAVHVTLQVWDVGSHISSLNMAANYLHGCDAVLAVFDITRQQTFALVCQWLELLKQMFQGVALPYVAMVASKADTTELQEQAAQHHCRLSNDICLFSYTVCAMSGMNVRDMFRSVAADLTGIPLPQPPMAAGATAAGPGKSSPHRSVFSRCIATHRHKHKQLKLQADTVPNATSAAHQASSKPASQTSATGSHKGLQVGLPSYKAALPTSPAAAAAPPVTAEVCEAGCQPQEQALLGQPQRDWAAEGEAAQAGQGQMQQEDALQMLHSFQLQTCRCCSCHLM